MSCTVKTKILDKLKEEKVISDTREILDFREFDRLNALYTKHAIEKYDLPTNGKLLIDVASNTIKLGKGNRIRPVHERTIHRAVPNDKLMDLLDDIIVDYKNNHTIVKPQNNTIKDGVNSIFEENPELANIGTPEQYSEYLDTIFPDSKVRDIVYHGANEPIEGEKFTKREGATGGGIWFSGSRRYAKIQMDRAQPSESLIGRKLRGAPTMYQVVLDIKNPKHFYDATGALLVQTPREFEKQYDKTVNDAALFHHPNSKKPATADSADQVVVFEPEQIHILGSKQDLEGFKNWVDNNQSNIQYQLPQGREIEEFVASEKTIRDLAARMSDRIGIPVRFESDRSKEYKGKLEHGTAVVNLAYATLDTPIHEILGHPIIRSIKQTGKPQDFYSWAATKELDLAGDLPFLSEEDVKSLPKKRQEELQKEYDNYKSNLSSLYQNLLKELEYGKGKEVLDRIKRDYNYKEDSEKLLSELRITENRLSNYEKIINDSRAKFRKVTKLDDGTFGVPGAIEGTIIRTFDTYEEARKETDRLFGSEESIKHEVNKVKELQKEKELLLSKLEGFKYTLEEQQEEALVELLGLMTAEKLDKVKDGKLISLLKRLLKEVKAFMRSLLNQREVEIDKLPDNMTLGNIADLLAYSNSKLILPGYEVIYTTPDNQQFKTYQEASNHISELARNVEDVDLDTIDLKGKKDIILPEHFQHEIDRANIYKKDNQWYFESEGDTELITNEEAMGYYLSSEIGKTQTIQSNLDYQNSINNFIEKNKEYEQSKEIIEEWKKVNNIQYNPEEVYSRGQEFVSVVGAYSEFDVDLMMQNLLQHIEDNQKAGGEFTISAFTKPVDRKIGHLEGGGGKIKFKIYPQSQNIKWAANTDVYSGSVWDASKKVSKDKKSELLGVSYSKYPSLRNVNEVQPNLANIIDNLAHHHNELGISLTGNNFRLEYDKDIPYTTKKLIDSINSILDQKYGKLVKPEIKETRNFEGLNVSYKGDNSFKTVKSYESDIFRFYDISNGKETITGLKADEFDFIDKVTKGIQPTQTNETLKESIEGVRNNLGIAEIGSTRSLEAQIKYKKQEIAILDGILNTSKDSTRLEKSQQKKEQLLKDIEILQNKIDNPSLQKDYTSQALINTKIARLKEVAKKYPRSLIRSEVQRQSYSSGGYVQNQELFPDDFPFQKIPSKKIEDLLDENKKDILFSEDKTQIDNDNTNSQTENLNNFILFNNQDGKFTAKDVLNNIKVNFDGFTQSSQDIINKLIPLLERTNATIKFVSNSALKHEDTLMEYNPKSNEIRISRDKLNDISEEYAVRTFLHEVVHSITVDAYSRPESIEAQMFRDFIDSMYNKYKELSGYKEGDVLTNRNYGFTNQIEFIAEIMTNPKFQAEIKELEGNKSWWNKLVDYIRTLVGLRKTSDYNNAIDYITNIALQSDYQGGLSLSNAIFEKKKTEEEDDIEDKRYIKLRTIEDRLSYAYDKIKDNIDQNLANYEKLIKVSKDSEKIEHYRDKLQELLDELEQVESDNEWKGIAIYTEQLLSNISQLENRFNKEDLSLEEADKTIYIYRKYLEANSLVKPVQHLISEAKRKKDLPITREELDAISKMLTEASGKYSNIESEILSYSKEAAVKLLNDRLYAPKVLFKWKEKLTREHKELGINENVISWVARQMNTTYKDEIDQEVLENAEDLVNDPSFDISTSSRLFEAALNTNNELVQVFQTTIDRMRNKIVEEKRTLSLELQSLFEEFINEKGDSKPSTLYKNMYEEDSAGNVYLKGEYSVKFKEQYDKVRSEHSAKLAEIESEYGRESAEFKNFYKNSDFKKWKDSNLKEITVNGKKKIIPVDKWKTDLSSMSEIEVKVLKKAREVFEKSQWQTYKINSLISDPFYGVRTYSLPAITASSLENILEGKAKELGRDKIKDLTSVRLDDIGYEQVSTDISGNPIRNVKVHFRGKLERGQQSLDLFSLMALEGYNGINYRNKQETESSLKTILDIAKNKVYYESAGLGTQILSRLSKRQRAVVKDSSRSNVYKRLESLMEMNIYDILHKDMGTLGPLDVNKAIGTVNGWTAMVGLSMNEISATANILNGKAQLFLEGVAGNYITFGAIAKAEARYFSELHNAFKDINKPVATSFINQLTEMFDTYGTISVSMKQAFIKNGILKSNLNAKSLQFMQDSGEHWMQSVLTMAVLDDIKVMDKDNNFIDKEGNIVKDKKKAASLLDMAKMKDGKLIIDEKVVYTTNSIGIKYNEGGKEMIAKLVKKKVFDTAGVYDNNMQPEAMRHGAFKLLLMFRRFLVSLGMARFRGLAYSHKKLPDLEDHQVFFSHALQDYETGTYTEAVRYILTSTLETLQQRKYDAFVTNWKELTTTQRKQFHKATADLVIMFVLLPVLATLLTAMGGDDGDDDLLAFALLQTVRLQSELKSFVSIDDQYKILNSPIPSLRIVETATDLFTTVFQPWNWLDEIEGGKNKGKLRIERSLQKLTPIWNSQDRTYKEYRTYIQNQSK